MADQYRQGDVFLIRVADVPTGAIQQPNATGEVVLALGEVTGHRHVIRSREAHVWNVATQRYVQLGADAVLTHEEHSPIALSAGVFEVRIQREYAPDAIRLVAD